MDWLGVQISIEGQIARRGEAFIPWSEIERAVTALYRPREIEALPKTLSEDLSPMGMLKRLAEIEGNLELSVDRTGDMVYLKKPEQ